MFCTKTKREFNLYYNFKLTIIFCISLIISILIMKHNIVKNARAAISKEKKGILALEKRFSNHDFKENFIFAVESIYRCKGKVIVTGIGKSGIIAQKIAATLNSTGTYSIYLHSADTLHGDLGIIREGDIAILISKSGDTQEIKKLVPAFKNLKIKIILITGNVNSALAKIADIILDASVEEEACPFNLAPTTSTTAALVLGDAVAISLLQRKGFSKENFAMYHPDGNLGKKLLLKIDDIMIKGDDIPVVKKNTKLKDLIYTISSKRLGCAVVVDGGNITGIVTDGDLRRLLEKNLDIKSVKAGDIMSANPKIIRESTLAKTALEIMEKNKITSLIVANEKKKLAGIIHMHTLVELGL